MRTCSLAFVAVALLAACDSFSGTSAASDGGTSGDAGGGDAGDGDAGANAELVFDAAGVVKTVSLELASATQGPAYATGHGSGPCPIAIDTTSQSDHWSAVVSNATGKPAVLEAWGVCAVSDHEINVVAYRGATVPRSASDLDDCVQASVGYNANNSEQPSGSGWCKGILAKNGQGVDLAPGERAVVVFEYHSDKTPAPNGAIRLTAK